jgi:hypothetical protein
MFVISVKTGKRKIVAFLAAALAVVTAVTVAIKLSHPTPAANIGGKKYSLAASTNEERIAFFQQFGWEVKPQPIADGEVTIPEKFDDVYTKYNNLQQEQGLDLTPYAGKTCKQWVYEITNYPEQKCMRGTLLVYDGRVIGGDLCTPALDGFMTGFDGQIKQQRLLRQRTDLSTLNGRHSDFCACRNNFIHRRGSSGRSILRNSCECLAYGLILRLTFHAGIGILIPTERRASTWAWKGWIKYYLRKTWEAERKSVY